MQKNQVAENQRSILIKFKKENNWGWVWHCVSLFFAPQRAQRRQMNFDMGIDA